MSIDVNAVSFHYPDGTPAVDELSFKAASGVVTAIVGPNGVGKTTLLELIAGDLNASEGVISIEGDVAYMRQNPGFDGLDTPTVGDALALGLSSELRKQYALLQDLFVRAATDVDAGMAIGDALDRWSGLGGYEIEATFDQITRTVLREDYDSARSRPLNQLSGGERKRIILNSFLVSPVPVLILDEPDNFLDLHGKAWLDEQLRATKKTILMVSHDRSLLTTAVDRILVLEHNSAWMHGGTYATLPQARQERAERLAKEVDRWNDEERRLFRNYKMMKQRASISPDMAKRADAAQSRW
ncbi:MAG: ATP-binding cassette domain-containing protein, partial [Acidimicrobiales bacterium]